MRGQTLSQETRSRLRRAWEVERDEARRARARGDAREEWRHLERAHVVSQPLAGLHIFTHASMFGAAVRRRDRREVIGQAFRLVVAGPGSFTGRYPVGNTGGAGVSAFEPMPIPEDLRVLLGDAIPKEHDEALGARSGS